METETVLPGLFGRKGARIGLAVVLLVGVALPMGGSPAFAQDRDVAQLPHLLIDTGPSYAQAVEHLAGLGHRSLAYVAGPTLSWSNRERHAAVEATAHRLGIGLVRIETSRPSFEAGQACAGELIAAGATAALAFDDVMAQGIMAGLAGRGLAVPRDFSLVGCDGVLATTTYPPLTSVETHCFAAGTQAVDLLFEVLRGAAPPHAGLRLPTELVIRETTAPPGASRPSSTSTRSPARARSRAATSPPRPAPTTTASQRSVTGSAPARPRGSARPGRCPAAHRDRG